MPAASIAAPYDASGAAADQTSAESARSTSSASHVLCGRSLEAEYDIKLHSLAFTQALESGALDRRVVNETIRLAALARDESEALGIIEPLYGSQRTHGRRPQDDWYWRGGIKKARSHLAGPPSRNLSTRRARVSLRPM